MIRIAITAEAFDATLSILMPHLTESEWAKLLAGLGGGYVAP